MGLRARRPGPVLAAIVALVAAGSTAVGAASAQASCDPIQTTPVYDPAIPTGSDVFSPPFEIGTQEVTSDQANDYMAAVDAASDKVITGTAAQTVAGKDLNYAIVGEQPNVTPAGLASIRSAIETLRDPQTSEAQAQQLAE